jgi:hypothetical protein
MRTPGWLRGIERVQLRDIAWKGRTWVREAEESPLLKIVAREWLLETMKAGEPLVFAAVIYKVWRWAVASLLVVLSGV